MKTISKKTLYLITITFLSFALFFTGCKKDDDSIINVESSTPAPGDIFVAPFTYQDETSGNIMILNSAGNLITDKKVDAEALDFRKWTINNTVYYSYYEHDPDAYHIPETGYVPGDLVLLDENLDEIKRLRLLPYNGRTPDDPDVLDSHEFVMIDEEHYIVLAYYEMEVDNIPDSLNPAENCRVVAPIIQEVQNGEVIFEWNGTNYPEFYGVSAVDNDFSDAGHVNDYMHINSVFIDPRDNNLICSFRNTDQVLKIHRTTGDIIWRLGGNNSDFPMTNEMYFYRQHHATLINNNQTLMLFDNGSHDDRAYSRIIEFDLDENSKEILAFRSLDLPDNLFAEFMGSVQKIGDHYFIGCGGVPKVLEINSLTEEVVLEIDLDETTYRAYKFQ